MILDDDMLRKVAICSKMSCLRISLWNKAMIFIAFLDFNLSIIPIKNSCVFYFLLFILVDVYFDMFRLQTGKDGTPWLYLVVVNRNAQTI